MHRYSDTRDNNITYWPLDYPPLSGIQVNPLGCTYLDTSQPAAASQLGTWLTRMANAACVLQSFLHGKLVAAVDPIAVSLWESRGHESYKSKHLLRWTVVLSDMLGERQQGKGGGPAP